MPGLRVSAYARQQSLENIRRLARRGLDVASFLSQAAVTLDRAVPTDVDMLPSPTWMTLDPASLLVTSMYANGCEVPVEEVMELEYASSMASNRVCDVVRNPRGVQTSHEIVAADAGGAPEYVELLHSMGVHHEVLVALRTVRGEHWGAVYLVRGPDRPAFGSDELDFLTAVAPHLAEGIRRGLVLGEAAEPEGPDAPGVVVLDETLAPESFTPGAQSWLADLPAPERGDLPAAVLSVAQVTLAGRGDDRSRAAASARVFSHARGWVVLHGQALAGDDARRVAVTIQPAGAERITPLLMAAFELTAREEEVTRHVLRGDSTTQIAEALFVSPYTVQEHLKRVFEKTGVRSRRELVTRVFARHYRARVTDNDARVKVQRPIRGGPIPEPSAHAQLGADTQD